MAARAGDIQAPTGDYRFAEFIVDDPTPSDGGGERWIFDPDTVQSDITAFELCQILRMRFELTDSVMQQIKSQRELMRHFRRVASPEVG